MGEMGEILKTDLTELEGNPTPRAAPRLQQERCQLELRTRPGGPAFKLDTRTFAASPLATAITTVLLIAVGCVVMGVAAMIGAPLWAAIGGLFVPAAVYAAIRAIHRNGDL